MGRCCRRGSRPPGSCRSTWPHVASRARAELVDSLVDAIELELLISGANVADHMVELPQCPAVDRVQGFRSNRPGVDPRVILQVPQQVTERVADLAVGLGGFLDAPLAHP